MKSGLSKRIISGMICGTLLLGSTGVAFAATPKSASTHATNVSQQWAKGNPLQAVLTKLVSTKKITQAKSNAIKAYMAANKLTHKKTTAGKASGKAKTTHTNMFDAMVAKGIITKADKTIIETAIKANSPANAKKAHTVTTTKSTN